jgi:hypothetical protein
MHDHKPNNLPTTLRDLNDGVPFLSELAHRLSIETKLLGKTRLVQPKHSVEVSCPVTAKNNITAHWI